MMSNRWIRTGDLGYIDEDGCVFILDRIKRLLIKYDGFKVFPAHVEEAALHSRYVENCCCVKKSDAANQCGELLCMLYPHSPLLKFHVAYTAAFVLQYPWRLSPFVSLGVVTLF